MVVVWLAVQQPMVNTKPLAVDDNIPETHTTVIVDQSHPAYISQDKVTMPLYTFFTLLLLHISFVIILLATLFLFKKYLINLSHLENAVLGLCDDVSGLKQQEEIAKVYWIGEEGYLQ